MSSRALRVFGASHRSFPAHDNTACNNISSRGGAFICIKVWTTHIHQLDCLGGGRKSTAALQLRLNFYSRFIRFIKIYGRCKQQAGQTRTSFEILQLCISPGIITNSDLLCIRDIFCMWYNKSQLCWVLIFILLWQKM